MRTPSPFNHSDSGQPSLASRVIQALRWRRCPACWIVLAASEFATAGRHRPGYGWKQRGRRCPSCGHSGATWVFKVVRERRATV